MTDRSASAPPVGDPRVVRRRRLPSLVWLVPALAVLIGLSMIAHAWLSAGPRITLSFQTAAGLEAGKTPVKYKDVTVGLVQSVALSQDGSHVLATVDLDKNAERLAREDTRFWVVRPRIGLNGVSGIDTLLSGAYIGVDQGHSTRERKAFTGLETPPTVINGMPGRRFVIRAEDLGSLDIGSPIYYRRIQVGRVASYQLDNDGRGVSLQVFVDAPYDRHVVQGTRFWNASGVDVSLNASGLKLTTQSLATVVAGGVAFATPEDASQAPATDGAVYALARDEKTALAPPDGPSKIYRLRFERSLRGLSVDAPVEFSGMNVGQVQSIHLDYDPVRHRFASVVDIAVYPDRLGRVTTHLPDAVSLQGGDGGPFLAGMVAHGLRAQARSGNLLTGQLYIALDFVPNPRPVAFDPTAQPLVLPTVNGDFDRMQEQIGNIVAKLDRIPLDAIGQHLDSSLAGLDQALKQLNGQVLPEATQAMAQARRTLGSADGMLGADAPLQQNLNQTLQEVQRTARSVRTLTDLLGRHPEALLRGMPKNAAPTPDIPDPTPPAPPEHTP